MNESCMKCGAALTHDDMGIYRKLISRGSTEFMCKKCLAEKLGVTVQRLDELIEYYRSTGCMLFN